MEYDYIIVGCGLAGIAFAETAINNGKSVYVFDNNSQNSSRIAAGIYNPVILKRFTEVWQAKEQLQILEDFYLKIEEKLNTKFDYKIPLLRKFFSIEEQNNWFTASDKPNLINYLSNDLVFDVNKNIDAPFGFGKVNFTGFVDTKKLIEAYTNYLISVNCYSNYSFQYNNLILNDDFVVYENIKAKHIVFAEGFGMLLNPFFSTLPLDGAKGELLIIKSLDLKLEMVVKTAIFIIPLGNDLYKVGATYNWDDKTNIPTQQAKDELLVELKALIKCEFEVVNHLASIRPTVKDRKPMLGSHPIHKNMHIFNGLGTRGVMLAPAMAKMLYNTIEKNEPLDSYVDIKRFKNFVSNFYQS
ncbi:NAD(P)/FAD-dependent oxidoreductase [Flavobacterium sp.]|uniref:NAD(P)/FAD-dependent oxidoreductase n=1 Tax=Flavobacterium sp. TaxID=239 RepID=UPI003752F7B0